jgi:hypothetical protein
MYRIWQNGRKTAVFDGTFLKCIAFSKNGAKQRFLTVQKVHTPIRGVPNVPEPMRRVPDTEFNILN